MHDQADAQLAQEEQELFQEMVKQKSPEFFCDNCNYYPIVPVHGHFECPQCRYKSKCCEGMALDV